VNCSSIDSNMFLIGTSQTEIIVVFFSEIGGVFIYSCSLYISQPFIRTSLTSYYTVLKNFEIRLRTAICTTSHKDQTKKRDVLQLRKNFILAFYYLFDMDVFPCYFT